MANYPYELPQDAACQSHTGRRTCLWFLPKLALGLNTNNINNTLLSFWAFMACYKVTFTLTSPYAVPGPGIFTLRHRFKLRAGWFRFRTPVGARFFVPVHTGP
jgi:hypothetical protein